MPNRFQAFKKLVVARSCSQKSISKENESKHDPTEAAASIQIDEN